MPRRFPIAQFPNRPMIVAIVAAAVAAGSDGARAEGATFLSRMALLIWAYEEIVSGANWFRRLLGVGGAAYGVIALKELSTHRLDG